jgi:hypothetical protein
MPFLGALTMTLALAAGSGDPRLLLCRPQIAGDAALARGDAVVDAGRKMSKRFLDYGVACDDAAEGARAARRAGLGYAIAASAEGRVEGSRYVLVLADATTEEERARRAIEVAPGADPAPPIRTALRQLLGTLPPRPGPRPAHVAAWSVAGAGLAAVVAGTVFALQARDAADRANAAEDLGAHVRARKDHERKRTLSGVALGAGGAALAAGLTWRFVF